MTYAQLIIYLLSQCLINAYICLANCEISNRFIQIDDCTCLGSTQTYECSVFGGGITIWNGSAFDCIRTQNEIRLRHSQYLDSQATGECNNDTVIATGVGISEGCYVSRLHIIITPESVNETIMCVHRDIHDQHTIISHTVLEIAMEGYPPPSVIQLEAVESNQLLFTWSQVIAQCPSIRYIITAKNCGVCPRDTSNTSIICSISPHTRGKCMFAVQTEICGSVIGERSEYVIVNLYTPRPPEFKLSCRHDSLTQNITVEIAFNKSQTVAMSDNIDGSPISYTVIFSDLNSGSICDLSTISAVMNSCESGKYCQPQWHKFATSISSPCSSNHDISISVFATNALGSGPFSQPVVFSLKTSESNYCSVVYGMLDSRSVHAYKQISTVVTYVLSALLIMVFAVLVIVLIKLFKDRAQMKNALSAKAVTQKSTNDSNMPQLSKTEIKLNTNAAYYTVSVKPDI